MRYFIILFFPFLMSSQTAEPIERDFNQDGFPDILESYYDGGSGFGGTYVTLTDGRTQTRFELNSAGCLCDFKKVVLIPKELDQSNNTHFLNALKSELLPKQATEADPSLQWLITANFNHSYLSESPFFDLIIKSQPNWITGEMKLPETYFIEIVGEKIEALYKPEIEYPEDLEFSLEKAFLIYYGHNHDNNQKEKFVLAATSDHLEVYKTSHGLVTKKNDKYSWSFVADNSLTGSPEKFRWESIGEVEIVDNYILFRMINSREFSNPIFIINSETGKVARLKTEDYIDEPFKIENDQLFISNYSGTTSIDLQSLIDEFEQIQI